MAFLYKNFVFSALGESGLGNAESDNTVRIDPEKSEDFLELIDDGNQAVLVIKEEVDGQPTKIEVVRLTGVDGDQLTLVRAQESTVRQTFTSAARISNTITAERAAILGGIANTDLEPDGERKVGTKPKPFMEVHAKNVAIKHGDHEFVIKPQAAEISADQDLFLPPGGGNLMRTQDTTESHPGCFLGELCVEPDPELRMLAARDTEYGHGIHIVSRDDTERMVKVAMHNSEGSNATLAAALGLEEVPDGNADDPTYRNTNINIGGIIHGLTEVRIDTVGDFYTAEGMRSLSFTLALFEQWLASLSFQRRADSILVSKHLYAEKLSAREVTIGNNRTMRIPVLAESPGADQDADDNFAVGSVVYATSTMVPYVCIDATAGAAKWRPFITPPISSLVGLFRMYAAGSITIGTVVRLNRSGPNQWGYWNLNDAADWSSYKRFYVSDALTSGNPQVTEVGDTEVDGVLRNVVIDNTDFFSGERTRFGTGGVTHYADGHTIQGLPWGDDRTILAQSFGTGNFGLILWGEE